MKPIILLRCRILKSQVLLLMLTITLPYLQQRGTFFFVCLFDYFHELVPETKSSCCNLSHRECKGSAEVTLPTGSSCQCWNTCGSASFTTFCFETQGCRVFSSQKDFPTPVTLCLCKPNELLLNSVPQLPVRRLENCFLLTDDVSFFSVVWRYVKTVYFTFCLSLNSGWFHWWSLSHLFTGSCQKKNSQQWLKFV